VKSALQKLRDVGLYVKLEKCVFHQQQGLFMNQKMIQAITNSLTFQIVCDILCLVRFANFYQNHPSMYSIMPLLNKSNVHSTLYNKKFSIIYIENQRTRAILR